MNWYKKAQENNPSDLTEEQKLKLSLLQHHLSMRTNMTVSKVKKQNNLETGQAIDYIYDRLERKLSPMTCKGCKWIDNRFSSPRCYNSNWKPHSDMENAVCEGISWEYK